MLQKISNYVNNLMFCGSPRQAFGLPRDDDAFQKFYVFARSEATWQSSLNIFVKPAVSLGILTILLSGCAIGPDYERPVLDVSQKWQESSSTTTDNAQNLAEIKWWDNFNDPDLSWMVEKIFAENLDLKDALARIRAARADYWSATTGLFPTVDGNGTYQHDVNSLNEAFGGRSGQRLRENDRFAMGFDASWEIDLFGRIFRASEAADAIYESEIANAQDVMISVVSEAASNYINLRRDQNRQFLSEKKRQLEADKVDLYRSLYDSGLIDHSALLEQKNALDKADSDLEAIKKDVGIAIYNIAVLMGMTPENIPDNFRQMKPVPQMQAEVMIGIPADIIERRPDIRRAEDDLKSETAGIGMIMGELLPKLTLTGDTTFRSNKGSNLFKKNSFASSYGPNISWSIMDFGKIRADIRSQEALRDQKMYQFQKAVLVALKDVENALLSVKTAEKTQDNSAAISNGSSDQLNLAQARYDVGLIDMQSLISQQTNAIDAESSLRSAEADHSVAIVSLYKALGGGWKTYPTQ